jgi:GTP cyclohydrolase I
LARGVEKHRAVMTTSAIRGEFRRNAAAREEFLRLMEINR